MGEADALHPTLTASARQAWKTALTLLLVYALPTVAATVELEAPKEIRRFLEPYLPDESPGDARRRLQKSLPDLLATEGYFTPRFDFSEEDGSLRVRIDPGRRTHIAGVDLTIAGPLTPERRQTLIESWTLPVGKPFRQPDWSAAKQNLLERLLAMGHAGARLTDSRADIDPATGEARLQASYDAGPPYRFGELKIEGLSRYRPDLVARYNQAVRPGEPYREDRLAALQNALQSTPYFSSVQVTLEREDARPGPEGTMIAPVRVLVRERSPHRIAFGAGISSNTGARVELNYHSNDLFRKAWELNSGIRLEQKRQTAYADVFLPPSPRRYRDSFGALAEHSDIQGLATERYALGVQRQQQRGSLDVRLLLTWQEERRRPAGAEETTNRALVPDSLWTWRQIDSLIDPRYGFVLQAKLGAGAKAFLSDRDFVRLYGRYQQFFPLGRRDVLTLRAELGYTAADSRQGIPQDYLFRAGGTNSVRGYAYQSLGVREGDAIVGGRYLATGSVEATHWLNERWGIAAFVDAGDAADTLKGVHAAVGYGVGARWKSPAGPIAVDVAYGQRTGKMQLHFSLAVPF